MSKLDLQKELLEKVKLRTKPSDIKKKHKEKSNQIPTSPDSPLIEPIKKTKPKPKPESPLVQGESKQIKQLQAQVNY